MKKMTIVAMSAFIAFNGFANTLDVKPNRRLKTGDAYVRVTKLKNNRIRFEKCISAIEIKTCKSLGNKSSYSLEELRSQRSEENREIAYTIGGDVLLVVGAAYGGFVGGAALGAISSTGILSSIGAELVGGGLLGTAGLEVAAIVSMASFDILNPVEQTRQAKTLNEEVITDKDTTIDSADMNDFIDRLDTVLSKI
jgi:hypothetical protein